MKRDIKMGNFKKKFVVGILISLLLIVIFNELDNNYHTVISGEVYRSAQLSAKELKQKINEYGIQTVINLRGSNPDKSWYQQEKALLNSMGLKHYDVNLTSSLLPRYDQLQRLLVLLKSSSRPLLIHCKTGADRTGLASSIVLLNETDWPLSKIQNQFSWLYFVFKPDSSGKQFLKSYRDWLQKYQIVHENKMFLKWATDLYQDSHHNIYFFINEINNQTWHRVDDQGNDILLYELDPIKQPELKISGWGVDVKRQAILRNVMIYVGDIPFDWVRYGLEQPQLFNDFGTHAYLKSGWEGGIDASKMHKGCSNLVLRFVRIDDSYWNSGPLAKICIK